MQESGIRMQAIKIGEWEVASDPQFSILDLFYN
jgi:hypothetical protein